MKVTPHVAQNTSGRRSAVPDAIAQTEGYQAAEKRCRFQAPDPPITDR
jgi:hypothetical protein